MLSQKFSQFIKKFFPSDKNTTVTDDFEEDRLKKYANVFMNKEFIEVQTYSNRGFDILLDPTVEPIVLPIDVSDETLGEALINALQPSRFLSEKENTQIKATWPSRYEAWVAERMQQFGYQDRYALFCDMDNCFILNFEGEIIIKPQYHDELENFTRTDSDGIPEPFYPETLPLDQLGANLRLAFTHCLNKKERFNLETKSKLRFEKIEANQTPYPSLHVYLEDEAKPFMKIEVTEDKELSFLFYAPSENIELNLVEWRHIRSESEAFLPEALSFSKTLFNVVEEETIEDE